MRILLLSPGTGHFFCGSCLRDNALAQGLMALGHDVLITPLYLPFVLEEEQPEEAVHMGGINMYLQQKVGLSRWIPRWMANALDSPKLLRWASKRGNMTEAADLGAMTLSMLKGEEGRQRKEVDKLIGWLETLEAPDVIVLSNVMLLGLARRLKETLGRPIVCTMQGEMPFLDGLSDDYREDAWNALRARTPDVDAFLPVSAHYGDEMRARLGVEPDRVHVVHNGIDIGAFESISRAPSGPTVGYLARMCRDKGIHTLVDAFLLMKERGNVEGVRLSVAGVMLKEDVPLVDELKQRIARAGFADEAEFLPNVDLAEKKTFLGSLSVLSVPATYGESFGLYLLEAMACGIPVVQPRHGSFPEVLEATGGGVLCEPDDPVSLANGLERMLRDETEATRFGEAGRRSVREHFTAERMARDVEKICTLVARP